MTALPTPSDGELLARARGGDGPAFAVFYRRHLPTVVRYLLSETHDRVEDRARRRLRLEPEALEDADLERVNELASGQGVLALVDELPDGQRAAVRARIVEERYGEIAAELECSPMVVRQQVSRGLPRLRQRLQGEP